MTTATLAVENGVKTWQLDSAHTGIAFAVKHLMISTVKGHFSDVSGTLTGDVMNPAGFQLDVQIGAASVDTRQAQRDAHLRSPDFFDAETYPSLQFKGKRVDGDTANQFKLIGDLTIRDVTREIVLDVTNEGSVRDPWGGDRVGFSARTKIDRRDFGLTYNQAIEAGGWVVGDEIKISVDVEFTAVPG